MTLSEKMGTIIDVIKNILKVSKYVDIKSMQKEYGATKAKIIVVVFNEGSKRRPIGFQVKDGAMNVLWDAKNADVYVHLTTDTFLNIMAGRMKRLNYQTGKIELLPYDFIDAWRYGDVRTTGDATTNDIHLTMEVIKKHFNLLKEECGFFG